MLHILNTLLTRLPREARPKNAIRGIVIAPTRELAVQIHSDAQVLARHTGLKLACVFGGFFSNPAGAAPDLTLRYLKPAADTAQGWPAARTTSRSLR